LGKFVEIFIPWEVVSPYVPFEVAPQYVAHVYGIVFTLFAMFYAVLGGMSSIVWADVIQYTIMTISAIVIGVIAMNALSDNPLVVPDGWMNPFFGARLDLDWSGIIAEVNEKIKSDGYSLFSIFFSMMLFKGVLVSPWPGRRPTTTCRRYSPPSSPKEAAKMSGFVSVILLPTRYIMIAGFAILGLLFYERLDLVVGGKIDFEQILPSAISEFVPVGFMGLLLAGLLAAFMSTFAGTLNAAQAYIVNDIYLKYLKPDASRKQVSRTNYLTGVTVVAISVIFGFFALDVNSVLQWIVSALWGAYVVSNVLKWYWWRFNGSGFFWGMLVGIVSALICSKIFTFLDLYYFPIILLASTIAAIAGTYLKPPTDEETLKSFYKNVKPWGFWKPIHDKVVAEDPGFEANKDFWRDMFNVVVGTIAQTALVVFPIYIVLKKVLPLGISVAIIVVCFIIMKRTWWDRLPDK
jgi:SSS family solute:Na+ symporter